MRAVAHLQPAPGLVALVGVAGDVVIDLGLHTSIRGRGTTRPEF
jgi:hypothetical protein